MKNPEDDRGAFAAAQGSETLEIRYEISAESAGFGDIQIRPWTLNMLERLTQIETRYDDLSAQMADPALVSDQQQYQKITKQHRDLQAVVENIRELKRIEKGIADAKAMA
ncbi:MAG: PCRF domain-containing protein, partial [Acidobacteriaceae bacterium]